MNCLTNLKRNKMSNKATTEEVLKLLHDQFDWNLTNSLTTTGEKLVADTIEAISIVQEEQDKHKFSEEEVIVMINEFDKFLLDNRGMQGLIREEKIKQFFKQFKNK